MYWCVDFGNGDYPCGVTCYDNKAEAEAEYKVALRQWKVGIRADKPEFLGFISLEEV